jgi:hypothetical protein
MNGLDFPIRMTLEFASGDPPQKKKQILLYLPYSQLVDFALGELGDPSNNLGTSTANSRNAQENNETAGSLFFYPVKPRMSLIIIGNCAHSLC